MEHKMVHTGEKAICTTPGCDRSYSNYANLKRHDRAVHEPEREAHERRMQRAMVRAQMEKERQQAIIEENEKLKRIVNSFKK